MVKVGVGVGVGPRVEVWPRDLVTRGGQGIAASLAAGFRLQGSRRQKVFTLRGCRCLESSGLAQYMHKCTQFTCRTSCLILCRCRALNARMCTKFALGVKVGSRRTTRLRLEADECRARARVSAPDKGGARLALTPTY
jgi:hypothetical protein